MKKFSYLQITIIILAILFGVLISHLIPRTILAQKDAVIPTKDNEELAHIYQDDQSDRDPAEGKAIDWKVVGPRDKARLARVKELYTQNQLHTGADYYHVAMVLQHSAIAEDYLLAHELSVVAMSKGEERAKWLSAASEDRFLMKIGRGQRFGTQICIPNDPKEAAWICTMEEGVSDEVRRALTVPTIAEARERAAKMREKKN